MTINVAKPFKSQTAKIFDKSKIGQDAYAGERFSSADVSLYSVKKIFKFGTTTAVVDDNLSKPKPLEHVVSRTIAANCLYSTVVHQKAVQSSSLFDVCADICVDKQKKILSKVKLAKNNITKLFKSTGHASVAVSCSDPFAIPSVEHRTTNDDSFSLSPPSILQHVKPEAPVATACESAPNSEVISFPIAYGENEVDEHIEDSAAFCSLAKAPSPSSAGQLFATPESPLSTLPSTFFLGELHAIEAEDGSAEAVVGLMNTRQKELAASGSYISRSSGDSKVISSFTSDTLSDYTTTHGVGLVSSETSTSPVDTSFATSVDAEDGHQFLPGVLRGLRRVLSYEDLRVSCFKSDGSHFRSPCSSRTYKLLQTVTLRALYCPVDRRTTNSRTEQLLASIQHHCVDQGSATI